MGWKNELGEHKGTFARLAIAGVFAVCASYAFNEAASYRPGCAQGVALSCKHEKITRWSGILTGLGGLLYLGSAAANARAVSLRRQLRQSGEEAQRKLDALKRNQPG